MSHFSELAIDEQNKIKENNMENEILKEKQKLESILGQFADLKAGNLGEIVIRQNEWANLIAGAVQQYRDNLEAFLEADAEVSRAEALAQEGVENTETKVASELLNEQ
jgi:hypothetical protein